MTNAEARFNNSLRPRKPEGSLGRTAQDVHLDSHTAPELWREWLFCVCCFCTLFSPSHLDTLRKIHWTEVHNLFYRVTWPGSQQRRILYALFSLPKPDKALLLLLTVWNWTKPRALVQNGQTRELISARRTSHNNKDVNRRRRLLLCWCDVFGALDQLPCLLTV